MPWTVCGASMTKDTIGRQADGVKPDSQTSPGSSSSPLHLIQEVNSSAPWETPNEDLEPRLERYAKAHHRALQMATWIAENRVSEQDYHRCQKLRRCGSYLLFRKLLDGDKSTRLYEAEFCQQPWLCPFCGIRRAAKAIQTYGPKLASLALRTPGTRLLFVTLTVRDGNDLGERLGLLRASLKRWTDRRRKALAGQKYTTQMIRVLGGMHQIELKRGKNSGLWHPHAHGVWLYDGRLDFKGLMNEWADLVGDPSAVSWFTHLRADHDRHAGRIGPSEFHDRLARDLVEVCKYPFKYGDLSPADNWGAFETCHRQRLASTFGWLHGVEPPSDLTDSAGIDWDSAPYVEMVFRYVNGFYEKR